MSEQRETAWGEVAKSPFRFISLLVTRFYALAEWSGRISVLLEMFAGLTVKDWADVRAEAAEVSPEAAALLKEPERLRETLKGLRSIALAAENVEIKTSKLGQKFRPSREGAEWMPYREYNEECSTLEDQALLTVFPIIRSITNFLFSKGERPLVPPTIESVGGQLRYITTGGARVDYREQADLVRRIREKQGEAPPESF